MPEQIASAPRFAGLPTGETRAFGTARSDRPCEAGASPEGSRAQREATPYFEYGDRGSEDRP